MKEFSASTLSDGVATLSNDTLSGLKEFSARTLTDGVATMTEGALAGVKHVAAEAVATSTLYLGPSNAANSWRVSHVDGALAFEAFDVATQSYKASLYLKP